MSKISFNLDKLSEKNGIAFYRVSGASVANVFFIAIDRINHSLDLYLSDNFDKPVVSIDPKKDFSFSAVSMIDNRILAPVLARAIDILNLDHYPSGISYAA